VTNLHSFGDLVGKGKAEALLTEAERAAFKKKFGYVSGSWCCAPGDEQKAGAPKSAHFSLMRA
jgi:hypothetical protein